MRGQFAEDLHEELVVADRGHGTDPTAALANQELPTLVVDIYPGAQRDVLPRRMRQPPHASGKGIGSIALVPPLD